MNEHDPVDHPAHAPQAPCPPYDAVHHPAHYTQGAIECIDAIESCLTHEEFVGFLRGQIMKYTWRLGLKGPATEDVGKIAWYTERLAEALDHLKPAELPARDWKPITAEEVKRLRDVARSAEPPARDQFRVQYNSVTFKDDVRPRYATRVYDLDGNMRLTYPRFEFNWDAVAEGNDWVARDPANGDVYSYPSKPAYKYADGEFQLAYASYERNLRDALPDGVFLIERVRLDG